MRFRLCCGAGGGDTEPPVGPKGDKELVLVASCTLRCPCLQSGEAKPGGKPVAAPWEGAQEVSVAVPPGSSSWDTGDGQRGLGGNRERGSR